MMVFIVLLKERNCRQYATSYSIQPAVYIDVIVVRKVPWNSQLNLIKKSCAKQTATIPCSQPTSFVSRHHAPEDIRRDIREADLRR